MSSDTRRWHGAELAALRRLYEDSDMSLEYIASLKRTSIGTVSRLAALHGWRRRRPISCNSTRVEEQIDRYMARANFVTNQIIRYERELSCIMQRVEELK